MRIFLRDNKTVLKDYKTQLTVYNTVVVDSSLLVYLDANNSTSYSGTGNTWFDLTSNSNNATLINTPTYVSDGSGKYFSFDGVSDYASITNSTALNNLNAFTNSYTIEIWLRSTDPVPSNSFGARIIEKRGATGNYPFSWQTNFNLSERLGFFVFDGTFVPFADAGNLTNLWNGQWHQTAMVVNNSTDRILAYRDGQEVNSSVNTTANNATNTNDIYIATNGSITTPYTGDISVIRIYNRVLSAQELLNNYNADKQNLK